MSDFPTQIVATWQNLVILRGKEILANLSEPGFGHYGVTWNEACLFALFGDGAVLDGTHQLIRVFDRNLQPVRDILEGEISGVHQIVWHDEALWITSTNTDTVIVADEEGAILKRWQPAGEEEPPGAHHINSIWFAGGYVYTLAHGLNEGEPAIHCHGYPTLEPVEKVLIARGAHNVYRNGHYLYLANRSIYVHGLPPHGVMAEGYIKGLSITRDRIYVGSSQLIDDRQQRRADPFGAIWEFNKAFDAIGKWELNAGPVNEIRTLDRPDLAHHRQPWTGKYGQVDR